MHWNISQLYTHMDYMPFYKSSSCARFVGSLSWAVFIIVAVSCSGIVAFGWRIPSCLYFFCFVLCLLLLWGLFRFDFLKRVPRNLYVRSRGKPTFILLFDFLFATCGKTSHKPEVYPLHHGSSPGWGARRARNRPGCWPGKRQDVFLLKYSVGESVIWKSDLYRSTVEWWWGVSEESELQCSRGSGHWGNVGWELC